MEINNRIDGNEVSIYDHLPFKLSGYLIRSSFIFFILGLSASVMAADIDELYAHMIEANKAQIVMLHETGLISSELASQLAQSLTQVIQERPSDDGNPDSYPDYLKLEGRLIEIMGEEASNLHLGRSRNDLGATMNRMLMRNQILLLQETISKVRGRIQLLASNHIETIIPGFTHGVQAQPTTLAHLLLALDASFQRDNQRLKQIYHRTNLSPLGSGAFTTSGFPLDRPRLAQLLGFEALVENSYDAIMVSTMDSKVELASALSLSAIQTGRFAQYLLFQYDDPVPGIFMADASTGRSSIMPQKRNPSAIERLRLRASEVVGKAHTSTLLAHNTPFYEVKDIRQDHLLRLNDLIHHTHQMFVNLDVVLESIIIRKDILLKLVETDYSTMTELADMLYREARVPFRMGHKVASELTSYGRSKAKSPKDLSWEEVKQIYQKVTGDSLPLSEAQIKTAFNATAFVLNRKGKGGPQPESVETLLSQSKDGLKAIGNWITREKTRLQDAQDSLQMIFQKIADS